MARFREGKNMHYDTSKHCVFYHCPFGSLVDPVRKVGPASSVLEKRGAATTLTIAFRFYVLTCVGCSQYFAAISCTVLSPGSASSATVALTLSEKIRCFVILACVRSFWIHLGTLSNFAGPLQITKLAKQTWRRNVQRETSGRPANGGSRRRSP